MVRTRACSGPFRIGRAAYGEMVGDVDAGRRLIRGRLERQSLAVQLLQHTHERLGHAGVELRAAALAQFHQALLIGERGPVHPA